AGRHQHDAVAEADVLGSLRTGGEEHFRRRRMRIFLEEVMLDLPGVVDAKLVGQLDLVERVLEELELVALVPRTRQLVLVEDSELHGWAFGVSRVVGLWSLTLASAGEFDAASKADRIA